MQLVPTNRFGRGLLLTIVLILLALLAPASFPSQIHAAPTGLFTVDHDGDASGQPCTGADNDCSLRSAIEHANGAGADSITFESGDMTIDLGAPLPALSDDDTTIASLNSGQVIEIDANGVNGNVFEITGNNVMLANLRIYGSGAGWANVWIHSSAAEVTIANNVIGDDNPAPGGCNQSTQSHSGIFISASGSVPADSARAWIYGNTIVCHTGVPSASPGTGIVLTSTDQVVIGENESGDAGSDQHNIIRNNGGDGIAVLSGASENVIRNSDIITNDGDGIHVANSNLNVVTGNTIGGNAGAGVVLDSDSDSNRLGCPLSGAAPATQRNVIRDNDGVGVHIAGSNTATNLLFCNWIGVNDEGTGAAPNGSHGVLIDAGAHNNIIGSTLDVANVISGNDGDGVRISGSDDNVILGNYIGTNKDGDAAVPNGISGVALVSGAGNNSVGPTSSYDARNVISGNIQAGVLLGNTGTTSNTIDGNYIGVDVAGSAAVPNGSDGITIFGSNGNAVGQSSSSPEQIIAYNGARGINIVAADATEVGLPNVITDNGDAGVTVIGDVSGSDLAPREIHSNAGLAIDLANDGHTPNDSGDGDAGPNTLLNYPIITDSTDSTITGTTCANCHVRIYEAIGDPAAPGGGGELVTVVNADVDGDWSVTLPFGLTRLDITVVARDSAGNTSEMAPRPQVFLPAVVRQ